jgi:phosphoribosyl 1,2-cyclic phosphodiesterase
MKNKKRELWHGTVGGYTNHDCRCPECTEAFRMGMAKYRARLQARPIPEKVHGTNSGYTNYGCRCPECTEAHRVARLVTR